MVQRNLVYVVGLNLEICYEETMAQPEYFGNFSKQIKQISCNRGGPYGAAALRNGPTGSAYVTFKRPEDARRCIEAVHGAVWAGAPLPPHMPVLVACTGVSAALPTCMFCSLA